MLIWDRIQENKYYMANKTFFKFIAILIFAFTISGCQKEPQIVYYQFTDEDIAIMPNYEKDQKIIFKNQNQEELIFNVSSAYLEKKQKTNYGFFGMSYLYFYDSYEIYIEVDVDENRFVNSLLFRREPTDIEAAKWDYTVLYPNIFHGVISFPLQNRAAGFDLIREYSEILHLEYDNTSFSNVRVFKTNNSSPWTPGDGFERRVHTIYYADKFGFIGFDDLDGNEWRIIKRT